MPSKLISLSKQLFSSPPKNNKYYIVAIDGRGGSGKTTLSTYIEGLLPDFCYICGDDYFEPIDHPIAWGGYNEERFDKDVIRPLKLAESSIHFRPYDWDRVPHIKDQTVDIKKGVFIDRCYSFSFDLDYDLKIWVETPREETLNRGIVRSSMPKLKAEEVWSGIWKPMEDRYIEEIKPLKSADIVVDGTKAYDLQLEL